MTHDKKDMANGRVNDIDVDLCNYADHEDCQIRRWGITAGDTLVTTRGLSGRWGVVWLI